MTVDIYCKEGCPPCIATIDYLSTNGVTINNIYYPARDREAARAYRENGCRYFPVVSVNDFQFFWDGYDEKKMDVLINNS